MTRRILVLTAALALFVAASARADLMLTLGNGTVTAEGTGTIDVRLRSTSPQRLLAFEFALVIDPPYDPISWLQFQPGQTITYHTDENYVFYDRTLSGPAGSAFDQDGNFYGASLPGVEPFIGWSGFDIADVDPFYVELTPEHDYLLARLSLVHSSTPPYDPVGDIFTASALEGLSAIFPRTVFYDDSFDEINFSWSPGNITIRQGPDPTVIPEPGSLLLCAVVALGAVPYLRRRRLVKA
jgi:hypothetical protein